MEAQEVPLDEQKKTQGVGIGSTVVAAFGSPRFCCIRPWLPGGGDMSVRASVDARLHSRPRLSICRN
jgi:hypothetical protein